MLFHDHDNRIAGENGAQAVRIQRLDGMNARDGAAYASFLQQARGIKCYGRHSAHGQDAGILPSAQRDISAYFKIRLAGMHRRFVFLAQA